MTNIFKATKEKIEKAIIENGDYGVEGLVSKIRLKLVEELSKAVEDAIKKCQDKLESDILYTSELKSELEKI